MLVMTADFLLNVVGPFTLLIAPPVKFFGGPMHMHLNYIILIFTGFKPYVARKFYGKISK